jgi:hypothetical protein
MLVSNWTAVPATTIVTPAGPLILLRVGLARSAVVSSSHFSVAGRYVIFLGPPPRHNRGGYQVYKSTTSGGTLGSLTIHAFHADDKCDPLSLPLSSVDRHLLVSLLFAAKAPATPAILTELSIRRISTSGSSATRAHTWCVTL